MEKGNSSRKKMTEASVRRWMETGSLSPKPRTVNWLKDKMNELLCSSRFTDGSDLKQCTEHYIQQLEKLDGVPRIVFMAKRPKDYQAIKKQLLCYLLYRTHGYSSASIGRLFGIGHDTVLYNSNRFAEHVDSGFECSLSDKLDELLYVKKIRVFKPKKL
jgi:hypothetical protein